MLGVEGCQCPCQCRQSLPGCIKVLKAALHGTGLGHLPRWPMRWHRGSQVRCYQRHGLPKIEAMQVAQCVFSEVCELRAVCTVVVQPSANKPLGREGEPGSHSLAVLERRSEPQPRPGARCQRCRSLLRVDHHGFSHAVRERRVEI